jgi:hypothetical protein
MRALLAIVSILVFASAASAGDWRSYSDADFGYSVALPDDGFDVEADAERSGLTLYERGGRGQIDVFTFRNDKEFSLEQIRDELGNAERIKQITYSRSGASWFVISGYYRRLDDEATDLIFYAKFMFSADRRTASAFEASYPAGDKTRYDPIIEKMEDSLTRPHS